MKSSITKRWVRGSLLFTLAVVLVAEGVFLFFTITGYYTSAERIMMNRLDILRESLKLASTATTDEKSLRLIRAVEQFEAKAQFEMMLVRASGSIDTTSSGVLPSYTQPPADIAAALAPGGTGSGKYVGQNERGERVLAITVPVPTPARGIVAMRLVTSLAQVDSSIKNIAVASGALFLAIVLASVVSGLYFIRSIVLPLHKVEATAARIAEGDFDTRITNISNDEIGSLCTTINHMADELSKSERMKNEFISSVSHELRTPLTSIKGWSETVGNIPDPGNPNFMRGMNIIASEADRLYGMVEELLDFSRMQDGLTLHVELLDLAAEVEEAVLLNTARAAGLGVALLYEAPPLPVPVMADKNRVRQVLVNVLDNAIKYSFVGGEVHVQAEHAGKNARVTVRDAGQGIPPEEVKYVRQKFYKGKGALRGSGIGLAVVNEIMAAHGGGLEIESELTRGTTISLCFPLHSGHKNDAKEKINGKTGKKS